MSKESRKKSSKKPSKEPAKGPAKPKTAAKAKTKTGTSRTAAAPKRGGTVAASKPTAKPAKAAATGTGKKASKTGTKTGTKTAVQAKSKTAQAKTAMKPAKPVPNKAPPSRESVAVAGLAEGARAPAFTLPRDGGGSVSLADYAGKKLVLFFYPKASTPGCTREAIDFTRLSQDFTQAGTAVLGVSADSVKAQDGFRDKHGLSVPLLSDATHEMLEAYGAWGEKSLYGRKFLGIIRSTVLIDADGRVAKVWRNVKVDGHADAVLAAAKLL